MVEHDLAKVGVEGSSPFARSSFFFQFNDLARLKACVPRCAKPRYHARSSTFCSHFSGKSSGYAAEP